MSRDFYFKKWKEALIRLKELIDHDVELQESRAHLQTLSDAVFRLSGVLGQYLFMYNELIECVQQNLQVQKTEYEVHIVQGVVSRIEELKHELTKLEGSNFQFIGYGLIQDKHTISDIELKAIPLIPKRPEHIQKAFDDIVKKSKKRKRQRKKLVTKQNEEIEKEPESQIQWWDSEEIKLEKEKIEREKQKQAELAAIPEEKRNTQQYLALILGHEKTRQVLCKTETNKLRRERWEKELKGILPPPAPYKIREKSAKMIQEVCRAYLESKRNKIKNSKRDELLGLCICHAKNMNVQREKAEEALESRRKKYTTYEKEWLARRETLFQEYLRLNRDRLCEEEADQMREWFTHWFETVHFFHDIPKEGSAAIFMGLVPEPEEWLEENNELKIKQEANKKRTPEDRKYEKQQAKKQERMLEKMEHMRLKAEKQLLEKMMKHPEMHPGYYYPPSNTIKDLKLMIDEYHIEWDMYDVKETFDVKERYVDEVDFEDAAMAAEVEVLPEVDKIVRKELHHLKEALKTDYQNLEEQMPKDYTKPIKVTKQKQQPEIKITERTAEAIEFLVANGFIVEYPKTKLDDYVGDPNFGGEDLHRQLRPAFPFHYEIRAFWWDVCRQVGSGFHKILLVGPINSGKIILVRALASTNNAILIELDPLNIKGDRLSAEYLKHLINCVISTARTLQPTVIHIKHVQKLFYSKTPVEEVDLGLNLIKKYIIQQLFNKLQKTDLVTVVGTCTEPWLAKTSKLLKQFPSVLVLPNTTYSLTVQLLEEWVLKHPVIPADFPVSNLAHVLQGYAYGYLKNALEKFLSAERIIKIAARGLTPNEVYDFIIEDENAVKVDYDKYLKWYSEKTPSGKRESQHLADLLEFKANCEKYAEKQKKEKKQQAASTASSVTESKIEE